jgi:hypothetical protein
MILGQRLGQIAVDPDGIGGACQMARGVGRAGDRREGAGGVDDAGMVIVPRDIELGFEGHRVELADDIGHRHQQHRQPGQSDSGQGAKPLGLPGILFETAGAGHPRSLAQGSPGVG